MARLHRDAMDGLIAEIVSGDRAPGEMLPREVDLAQSLGVSRGVARETVRAMEERGMVTVRHGRGATVNPPERWNVLDPEVLGVMLGGPGRKAILSDYLECRRIIEVAAAGLAAERGREPDLARASRAIERMEEAARQPRARGADDRLRDADADFHRAIVAASGNRALAALADRLLAALRVAPGPRVRARDGAERVVEEHRRILAAVASGDAEVARAAMSAHLAQSA